MTEQDPKQLNIPYLPQLEGSSLAQAQNILEESGARRTIESLNWPEQYPYHPLTVFTAAHSGKAIYIDFFVRCNYLKAVNYTDQSPVCQDSCVEFFVSPRSDERYWNFEFNCIGAINASTRAERHNPRRLSPDELAQVKRMASCGSRPFEEVQGLFAWDLLVEIPLSLIDIEYKGEPIAMKGNFYKCASGTSLPHFLSWAPIVTERPDFHQPQFFGDIILD